MTAALKPGANRIEIKVTNLWPNRMIGQRFVTLISIRFGPGLSASVTSARNGGRQRRIGAPPLTDTSAISFTAPRSSISFAPGRNHAGSASKVFV